MDRNQAWAARSSSDSENPSPWRDTKILSPHCLCRRHLKREGKRQWLLQQNPGPLYGPKCLLCGSDSLQCLFFQESQSVAIFIDTQMQHGTQLCKVNPGSHRYHRPRGCRLLVRGLFSPYTQQGQSWQPTYLSDPQQPQEVQGHIEMCDFTTDL